MSGATVADGKYQYWTELEMMDRLSEIRAERELLLAMLQRTHDRDLRELAVRMTPEQRRSRLRVVPGGRQGQRLTEPVHRGPGQGDIDMGVPSGRGDDRVSEDLHDDRLGNSEG